MHELSIAEDILEMVNQNAPIEELQNVRNVKVKVGDMSGVVADSLEFCFQAITSETKLKNARLLIASIPFVVSCNSCKSNFTNSTGIRICPNCSGSNTMVISGLELEVTEIELDTEVQEAA
jgi:hydrogenase nickel incorporation protein HypA/HybF